MVGFQAEEITFTSDTPLPWSLDGEFGGEHTTFRIENSRQAVRLVCGK